MTKTVAAKVRKTTEAKAVKPTGGDAPAKSKAKAAPNRKGAAKAPANENAGKAPRATKKATPVLSVVPALPPTTPPASAEERRATDLAAAQAWKDFWSAACQQTLGAPSVVASFETKAA